LIRLTIHKIPRGIQVELIGMKWILRLVMGLLLFVVGLFVLLYFIQEKIIFFPTKLPKDYKYPFDIPFEEVTLDSDGEDINSILFTKPDSKGVVLYLHGNAGNLSSWAYVYEDFQYAPYDVWIIDYRGYGKSTGSIQSEADLHADAEALYQAALERYEGKEFIIYGRSIGSGVAAKLAKTHPPKILLLETPYYNFPDLVKSIYPFLPKFLLRYQLSTDQYIANTEYPVYLFHGTKDELIPYTSSLRLAEPSDKITLHTLEDAGHNNISDFPIFRERLLSILGKR